MQFSRYHFLYLFEPRYLIKIDILEEFTQLVWDYCGPNGIYPLYFELELTIDQVENSVILVYDYFRNRDIEFGEGSIERGVVLNVMIQMYTIILQQVPLNMF